MMLDLDGDTFPHITLAHLPDGMTLGEAADRDDVRQALTKRARHYVFKQQAEMTVGELRRMPDAELRLLPFIGEKTVIEVRKAIGTARQQP